MIHIGTYTLNFADPATALVALTAAVLLFMLVLLIMMVRRSGANAEAAKLLATQLGGVSHRVENLSNGQQQLFGGLTSVTEAQAQQQAQTLKLMEQRLAEVNEAMGHTLSYSAQRTAQSLGELQQRLQAIDKAQDNITKLSGDVLSLQDILSNKQTRGAFGEIQLNDIVSKALPADSYAFQKPLSNGSRPDCLIDLPNPPGPIVIDAKFPLEAYEALRSATSDWEVNEAAKAMRTSVRKHIKDISEKYVLEGETADGALMFLPSEAVYAELHANFPELIRDGFAARVWIVSPTTCMATLNTMRAILKDARLRKETNRIRRELSMLLDDVQRLGTRVENLDRHFNQAQKDISDIKISAEKAGKRAKRLDTFDFEDLSEDPKVVPIASSPSKN